MRLSACISIATLSALGVLAVATDAHAQETAPTPVAPPAEPAAAPAAAPVGPAPGAGGPAQPMERPDDSEEDKDFKPVALTLNPLSLILTRIGINAEYMLAAHHGLILNPFFQSITAGAAPVESSYTNFGAELGYRFYTGTRGANGFFVGPFATFISSSLKTTTGNVSAESNISIYGGGVDLGGQHVFRNGFTIGGGAGVMYVTASETNAGESTLFKVSGVLPRFLFTIGYSF